MLIFWLFVSACLTGPGGGVVCEDDRCVCDLVDVDGDSDVDLADVSVILNGFGDGR